MKSKRFVSILLSLFLLTGTALTGCFGDPVLSISPATISMKVGETKTITPNTDYTGEIAWTSSNSEVAMVTGGKVVAFKAGTAVITAFAGATSASCQVTVSPASTSTVTFVTGEGATAVEPKDVSYGSSFTFPVPVRPGYDFVGWFGGAGESANKLTDAGGIGLSDWNVAGNISLYAHWKLPSATSGLVFHWSKANAGWEVSAGTNVGSYKVEDSIIQETYVKSTEHIVIPNNYQGQSVVAIAENGFRNCYDTVSVKLPAFLKVIGTSAFENNPNLETIGNTLPTELAEIRSAAFKDCKKLNIGGGLPETLNASGIGASAFANCESLTMPINFSNNSVSSIPTDAFAGCKLIPSIKISTVVTSIGVRAFDGCSGATTIDLTAYTGTAIHENAFRGCTSVSEIYISDKINHFGHSGVFEGCTSLKKVTFGATFGNSYQSNFWNDAFKDCPIDTVEVVETNAFLEFDSEDGVLFVTGTSGTGSSEGKSVLWYLPSNTATEYTVPDGILYLLRGAFDGVSALETLALPESMVGSTGTTAIRGYSIINCESLTTIYLKNAGTSSTVLTWLATNNFINCPLLAKVYVENSTSLGYYQANTRWGSTVYTVATNITIDLKSMLAVKPATP